MELLSAGETLVMTRTVATWRAALGLIWASGGVAQAEPISFFGLNLAMAPDEIKAEVERQGYTCQPSQSPMWNGLATNGGMVNPANQGPAILCFADPDVPANWIVIADHWLGFHCSLFDVCNLRRAELAQWIVDLGVIERMSPLPAPAIGLCGDGPDGDHLCVLGGEGDAPLMLAVFRGTLGEW
jgi:hypothetical protein